MTKSYTLRAWGHPLKAVKADSLVEARQQYAQEFSVSTHEVALIFEGEVPIYKAHRTPKGWQVFFHETAEGLSRPVDGSKVYPSRQNAYARAQRLNKSLPQPLETILRGADVAEYEFDNYIVAVGDRSYAGEEGYNLTVANLTVAKEALPPHVNRDFNTLEEVEEYLNGTLGYTKGDRKWTATEREDD